MSTTIFMAVPHPEVSTLLSVTTMPVCHRHRSRTIGEKNRCRCRILQLTSTPKIIIKWVTIGTILISSTFQTR
ncbi:hypothetical protein ANCCEY_04616 [Ancylostoma ceylanicum]|uniref:Uncharacterized protein n=1 Tax=Ancylostoma ceylanicum TaxID=53326 RepID=A0A0D6LYQ4_9BILA|nr:hypothetical protein ANCCEY_04616 [Ancylostoma ceylanicum]